MSATDLQKTLAQSALDGIGLVCSDLEMLHRELTKTDSLGSIVVMDSLKKPASLEQELQSIWMLIK